MAEFDPSQFVLSTVNVVPSDCLIVITYDVIGEPPVLGALQLMATLFPLTAVVGAMGVSGIPDALTSNSVDSTLSPTMFLAYILNPYTTSGVSPVAVRLGVETPVARTT